MSKRKNEYIVAVATKIVMVVLGLAESVLLARFLGAELKGQVSYINSITQVWFIIATLGIYTAYPYFRQKSDSQILLNRFMSITIAMLLVYLLGALISVLALNSNKEWMYIVVLIPVLFYDKVISFIWMIEEPNRRNAVVLAVSIGKLGFYALLYWFAPQTLFWGITTLIFAPLLESFYFTYTLKFKIDIRYCRPESFWPLLSYGFLPMIAVLLTTLNYRIDIIMLRQYSDISLQQIGVYSIGITLAEKVLLVSDAAKEILLSKLAKGKGEKEVARVMRYCFLIALFLAVGVSVVSKVFIKIMYGVEYSGAEVVTNISVWGTIFMVYFKMISQYNVANKKQKYNVIFLGVAIVLNIIMNAILIPKLGINGAAMATAIGYFFSSACFMVYFHRISNICYRDLIIANRDDIAEIKTVVKKIKGQ